MSYNLTRDKNIRELVFFSYNFKGFVINPKSHGRKNMISASKMVVTDPELISGYINAKLDRKFKNLVKLVYDMLETPGEDESDITSILGEINRLKGIIENKYKYYLNVLEYDRFMKKILLIEKELKEKIIEIQMSYYYYNNETEQIEEKRR